MADIVVCDNNKIFLNHFSSMLKEILKETAKEFNLISADSFCELSSILETNGNNIDIIFMDIELGDGNGIELTKRINSEYPLIAIVYVTGHLEYAKSISMSRFTNFLIKPVTYETAKFALNEALSTLQKKRSQFIIIKVGNELLNIDLYEIRYIENEQRKLVIHTVNNDYKIYYNISEIKKALPKSFIKCHKSFIVNADYVKRLTPEYFFLDNDAKIPLAQKRKSEIRNQYINYICNSEG